MPAAIGLLCPPNTEQPNPTPKPVCLEGYAACNPAPATCKPGYGFDGGAAGSCQLCRIGRVSPGGTPEKPVPNCLGCPARYSTPTKGTNSSAGCTSENGLRCGHLAWARRWARNGSALRMWQQGLCGAGALQAGTPLVLPNADGSQGAAVCSHGKLTYMLRLTWLDGQVNCKPPAARPHPIKRRKLITC